MKIRKKRKIIEMLIRNAIRDTEGGTINRFEWIDNTIKKHLQAIKSLTEDLFNYKNEIRDIENSSMRIKINSTIKELQENYIFI